MRKTIPRKRALVQAGNEAADRLIDLVGRCEWCQESYDKLAQHEIASTVLPDELETTVDKRLTPGRGGKRHPENCPKGDSANGQA